MAGTPGGEEPEDNGMDATSLFSPLYTLFPYFHILFPFSSFSTQHSHIHSSPANLSLLASHLSLSLSLAPSSSPSSKQTGFLSCCCFALQGANKLAEQCDRDYMDEETRRLKNRLRQQRYRARKRLEKTLGSTQISEENQNELSKEGSSFAQLLPAPTLPKATNGSLVLKPGQSSLVDEACKEVALQDATGSVCAVLPQVRPGRVLVLSNPFFAGIQINSIQNPNCSNAAIAAPTFQIIQPMPRLSGSLNVNVARECTDKDTNALLALRQKNRDRQRRYRARKRLEADLKSGKTQDLLAENGQQPFIPSIKLANRVYCSRDWKTDARLASSQTEAETQSSDSSEEGSMPEENFHVEKVTEDDVNDPETTLSVASIQARRDWKADARNKLV